VGPYPEQGASVCTCGPALRNERPPSLRCCPASADPIGSVGVARPVGCGSLAGAAGGTTVLRGLVAVDGRAEPVHGAVEPVVGAGSPAALAGRDAVSPPGPVGSGDVAVPSGVQPVDRGLPPIGAGRVVGDMAAVGDVVAGLGGPVAALRCQITGVRPAQQLLRRLIAVVGLLVAAVRGRVPQVGDPVTVVGLGLPGIGCAVTVVREAMAFLGHPGPSVRGQPDPVVAHRRRPQATVLALCALVAPAATLIARRKDQRCHCEHGGAEPCGDDRPQ
jgi:hypothetical protein